MRTKVPRHRPDEAVPFGRARLLKLGKARDQLVEEPVLSMTVGKAVSVNSLQSGRVVIRAADRVTIALVPVPTMDDDEERILRHA
jgi:hypothetical protein